jgi:hypothetical protein
MTGVTCDFPTPFAALCFSGIISTMQQPYSDHNRLDARSLALHEFVARKIEAVPALLGIARANLRRDSPSLALAEWEHILSSPLKQVLALLVERSERATRLRQSSPFCGILTEAERRAIYESYSTRTHDPRGEPNATGLCLDPHDLVLSKYAAGREKDLAFNQALARYGCVNEDTLLRLAETLPVDAELKDVIVRRIKADFSAANSQTSPKPPKSTRASFRLFRRLRILHQH